MLQWKILRDRHDPAGPPMKKGHESAPDPGAALLAGRNSGDLLCPTDLPGVFLEIIVPLC